MKIEFNIIDFEINSKIRYCIIFKNKDDFENINMYTIEHDVEETTYVKNFYKEKLNLIKRNYKSKEKAEKALKKIQK